MTKLETTAQMTNELDRLQRKVNDVFPRISDRLKYTDDRLMEYVDLEDRRCPTGMTLEEYITDLERQVADALAACEKKNQSEYVPHP